MIIAPTNTPKDWSSENSRTLRNFLATETGTRLMEWLAYYAPELLDGSDVNKTLVASGVYKGYHKAVSQIISLVTEQPKEAEAPEMYPSLDNDGAWEDTADNSNATNPN